MTVKARIVETEDGLRAEAERSEACHQCGACQYGRTEKRLYPLPEGDWKVGDELEISLPDEGAIKASLIAYGIPLAVMLICLALGYLLGLSEIWQAALAVSSLALSWAILRALDPRLKKSGRFTPSVRPCGRSGK